MEYIESDEYVCSICFSGDDESRMLLCDGCDGAFHTYCIGLDRDRIPEGIRRLLNIYDVY